MENTQDKKRNKKFREENGAVDEKYSNIKKLDIVKDREKFKLPEKYRAF
ncbi:MAG: hypothetical protein Q4D94_09400 [Bacillota bacterium]|nr:hypothetical protein [Bacillota bacterium]